MKEFVAAGDNPVYPDVVVALRTLSQALDRASTPLEEEEKQAKSRLAEAHTVAAALTYYLDQGTLPTRSNIREEDGRVPLSARWFTAHYRGGDRNGSFDWDTLNEVQPLEEYLATDANESAAG